MNETDFELPRGLPARHRRWVANHFAGKVNELLYYLTVLVDACDESMRLLQSGEPIPKTNEHVVVYSFSSFANVIQTLKDAAKTIIGRPLPWSAVEHLRHGLFMRAARNAATHDGYPLVSGWADGRYFFPNRIVRFDHGRLIEIPAPERDVRTLCLEFAGDFCGLLAETLASSQVGRELGGIAFEIDELDEALASPFVPEFVRQLAAANRDQIDAAVREADHNPVAQALDAVEELRRFCTLRSYAIDGLDFSPEESDSLDLGG